MRGRFAISLFLSCCFFIPSVLSLFCGADNCYEVIGIPRNSTKAEIRRAYRRLSAEAHPDNHPNDEKAKERFRKIVNAYEALTDDAKRAKYEDFLDNPGKYWDYLVRHSKDVYAPKSNTILVLFGILVIINLVHWLNMNNTYRQTLARFKESQEFKSKSAQLIKSKKASSKEEAEAMINLDIVGLEKPHWKNLIIFKMFDIPKAFFKLIAWKIRWVFAYNIRKTQYSEEDKLYLIQKNLSLSDGDMKKLPEKEKKAYLADGLWDKEKADDFLRMKRIEMNRLGKGKKKSKHTPIPYSEAEEVSMD